MQRYEKIRKSNHFSNLTSNQLKPKLLRRLALVFPWLVPRMGGETELGMMDGDETSSSKVGNGSPQLLWHGVDLAPVGIVLAVLHDGEVDVGKPLPEALEATAVAAIAREEDLSLCRFHQP